MYPAGMIYAVLDLLQSFAIVWLIYMVGTLRGRR